MMIFTVILSITAQNKENMASVLHNQSKSGSGEITAYPPSDLIHKNNIALPRHKAIYDLKSITSEYSWLGFTFCFQCPGASKMGLRQGE